MALMTRVSRLFTADMHAMLDCVEEPETLLRQAIREMEEALAEDEHRIARLTRERRAVAARHQELATAAPGLDEQLDACIGSGKEELARHLVRRKLEAEGLDKLLARQDEAIGEALTTLGTRMDDCRARLAAMRQKWELCTEQTTTEPDLCPWDAPAVTVREEDVEIALLREQQKRHSS